jgi:EXS family
MSSTQEVGEIFGAGSGPAHAMLRSPTVLIASVGLWGMNVYFFKLFGIDYVKVLRHDLDEEKRQAEELYYHHSSSGGDRHINSHHHHPTNSRPYHLHRSSSLEINSNGKGNSASSVLPLTSNTTAPSVAASSSSNAVNTSITTGGDYSDDDMMMMYNDDKDDYEYDEQEAFLLSAPSNASAINSSSSADPSSITWGRLVIFSLSLLVLLHATYGFWIDVLGKSPLMAVFAFYGAVTTAVLVPLPSTKWLRKAVVLVLQRSFELVNPRCNCIVLDAASSTSNNPHFGHPQPHQQQQPLVLPRPIPFVDVFFADAMCSLSKVFFDWGMLLHMAAHYPRPVPPSPLNIVIPSAFAAVPFVIRARQCMVMYQIGRLTNQHSRFSHLANAVKYGSSIFPLLVSAYQKTVSAAASVRLEPLLILLLVINALYALYWDVVMDWGLLQNPSAVCKATTNSVAVSAAAASTSSLSVCHHLMRPKLRFGIVMSALIVLADSILRFSWTLRFYHALFPSGDSFVLCTQFLEVFRRALWNLLRIEWEHLKQQQSKALAAKKRGGSGSSADAHGGASAKDSIILLSSGIGGNTSSSSNGGPMNLSASSIGPVNSIGAGLNGSSSVPGGSLHGGSSAGLSGGGIAAGGSGVVGPTHAVAAAATELTSYIINKRPKEATA